MSVLKRVLEFFGFNRDSKYVTKYIRDANIRSGIFMAAVIVILEIWLVFRQFHKYIIPLWGDWPNNHFQEVLYYTSTFWLFLFVGVAVFIFSITFTRKNIKRKTKLITNFVASGIVVVYFFEVFNENYRGWSGVSDILSNTLLLSLYILALLLAIGIIAYTILNHFKKINHDALFINVILILFALMCLAFGVKVSYSDYISSNPIDFKY